MDEMVVEAEKADVALLDFLSCSPGDKHVPFMLNLRTVFYSVRTLCFLLINNL